MSFTAFQCARCALIIIGDVQVNYADITQVPAFWKKLFTQQETMI
jgi:hypothetical protein